MVFENFTANISSDSITNTFLSIPGISSIMKLGKAVGIAILVYIIFMIVRTITQIISSRRSGRMIKNIDEINRKMDIIIKNIDKSKAKKK
jgi:hypothetical protein